MKLPAFIAEAIAPANRSKLRFVIWTGYALCLGFAVLAAAAALADITPWRWAFVGLVSTKILTNSLAWLAIARDRFVLLTQVINEVADVTLLTGAIYFTGGPYSPLVATYVIIVAVAVSTDRGLVTPVLRGLDRMSISAVAVASADLVGRARSGRLREDELVGGTLTVTNLGPYGTEAFTALINPPQSAILAVGAAREEAVVRDGELAVGTVMHVTLSVDHRPVDGAVAAEWMAAFLALVEEPVRILA